MQIQPGALATSLIRQLDRDGDGALAAVECAADGRGADRLQLSVPQVRAALAALDPAEQAALAGRIRKAQRLATLNHVAAGSLLVGMLGGAAAAVAATIAGNLPLGATLFMLAVGSGIGLADGASQRWAEAGQRALRRTAARLLFAAPEPGAARR